MDLRQLRYFVAIVEHGSFSKAANHLGAAQPALSQHVRHMEDELGVRLLHRGPRGVLPTEAGERLLRRARSILAQFAEIRDGLRAGEESPSGEVRIGLPGTVGESLGVPLVEAARARYPGVRLRLVEAMSGFILDWLRRGDIELAVLYGAEDPRGLATHHVLTEELCLVGRPDSLAGRPAGSAVSLAAAAALPLILPGLPHGLRNLIEDAALAAGIAVRPEIEVDSYGQIKLLAQRGLGLSILPRGAVQRELASGGLVAWPIAEPPLLRCLYLAHSTERPLTAAGRALGELAWEQLRALVRDGTWTATLAPGDDRLQLCRQDVFRL